MSVTQLVTGFALIVLGLLASQLIKWRHGWLVVAVLAALLGALGVGYAQGEQSMHHHAWRAAIQVDASKCTQLAQRIEAERDKAFDECFSEIRGPQMRIDELEPPLWPGMVSLALLFGGLYAVALLIGRLRIDQATRVASIPEGGAGDDADR